MAKRVMIAEANTDAPESFCVTLIGISFSSEKRTIVEDLEEEFPPA